MVSVCSIAEAVNSSAETALNRLNVLLQLLDVPHLSPWHFNHQRQHTIEAAFKNAIGAVTDEFEHVSQQFQLTFRPPPSPCDDCQDLLQSFKERYSKLETKDMKYLMLSCAPKSIKAGQLLAEVNCKPHEARAAVELRHRNGFNAFRMPIWNSPAHPLPEDHKRRAEEFYLSDNCSRVSPNMRDVRQIRRSDGSIDPQAKRLILMNSSELYKSFSGDNPDIKMHFSTFMKLRPKWCKWPGRYGHHNTCTCVIHENFMSRLRAVQYKGRISEFIQRYLCPNPQPDCFLGQCQTCPTLTRMSEIPIQTEEVVYDLWRHTDRANYVTVRQDKETFVAELQEEFSPFVRHHYVMKQQAEFIESLKQRILTEDAVICYVDFAENYSFNVQNAIQAFHWNNNQATIHPFVVMFRQNESIVKKSFIVVSDTLEHSAVTYHWFRSLVIQELKKEEWFTGVKKIYYVSDGAGMEPLLRLYTLAL